MKTTIFVLTLLIFVSLCTSTVPSSYKPVVEGPASADFCYKCARYCFRRHKYPHFCQGFVCRCSINTGGE
ncbi:unnamed protein product [Arabidopsis halleri]